MLKKFFISLSILVLLSFTSCGGERDTILKENNSDLEVSTPTVTPTPTPTENTAQTSISKLKKTGQTTAYEQFDDGDYQIGITPSYSRRGDIVTDNVTKLQWQDNTDAKTVRKTWEDAKNYCSSLSLGGYNDWRLPTIKELNSIVDYGKYDHTIDSTFSNVIFDDDGSIFDRFSINSTFVNVTSFSYWSATTGATDSSSAWYVSFTYGNESLNSKVDDDNYIRCVRGGQL